jgi:deoxyadenosine/deoxycytidine kinase
MWGRSTEAVKFIKSKRETIPRHIPHYPIKPIIISVEGNIGSGKSSLIKSLIRYNSLCGNTRDDIYFMPEPITSWIEVENDEDHILNLFYTDMKKYSLAFQTLIATTYRSKILEIMRSHPRVQYIITERSLYTSYLVFAKILRNERHMTPIEYKVYESLFIDNTTDWMFPDRMIYMDTSINKCLERISQRQSELQSQGCNSRDRELLVDRAYLELVRTTHNNLTNFKPGRDGLLILNGDSEDTATRDSWPAQIMQSIPETHIRYNTEDEYLDIRLTFRGFTKRTNMFRNEITLEQIIDEVHRLFRKIKRYDQIHLYWRGLESDRTLINNTNDVFNAINSMKEDGAFLYRFEVEVIELWEQPNNLRRSDRLRSDSPESDHSTNRREQNSSSSSRTQSASSSSTSYSALRMNPINRSSGHTNEEGTTLGSPSTPINVEIMRPSPSERIITSKGKRSSGIISPPTFKIRKGKPFSGLNPSQKCDTSLSKQLSDEESNESS